MGWVFLGQYGDGMEDSFAPPWETNRELMRGQISNEKCSGLEARGPGGNAAKGLPHC